MGKRVLKAIAPVVAALVAACCFSGCSIDDNVKEAAEKYMIKNSFTVGVPGAVAPETGIEPGGDDTGDNGGADIDNGEVDPLEPDNGGAGENPGGDTDNKGGENSGNSENNENNPPAGNDDKPDTNDNGEGDKPAENDGAINKDNDYGPIVTFD